MDDLTNKLQDQAGENVIIHFVCGNCHDEQVSYLKKAELFLNEFTAKGGCVMDGECTVCKQYIGWIPLTRVKSLEV
ncbi:hypothetical protein [Carboxylicivirga sp. RSCT41]|uniref:hypothetical protein n=1 Tax=Carboxylicivirga agarovorans TaxID=3417570 RepID=UPI003D32DB74